jgi:hypothetical protein
MKIKHDLLKKKEPKKLPGVGAYKPIPVTYSTFE